MDIIPTCTTQPTNWRDIKNGVDYTEYNFQARASGNEATTKFDADTIWSIRPSQYITTSKGSIIQYIQVVCTHNDQPQAHRISNYTKLILYVSSQNRSILTSKNKEGEKHTFHNENIPPDLKMVIMTQLQLQISISLGVDFLQKAPRKNKRATWRHCKPHNVSEREIRMNHWKRR